MEKGQESRRIAPPPYAFSYEGKSWVMCHCCRGEWRDMLPASLLRMTGKMPAPVAICPLALEKIASCGVSRDSQ
jgi:hypothetical protein